MRRLARLVKLALAVMLCGGSGCSTLRESDSDTLQGTWEGQELGERADGSSYFIISGNSIEFRGANPGEWYKGTFLLREEENPRQIVVEITECPFPEYIGKTAYAIYRLEGETLTLTGNEPGGSEVPAHFNVSGARQFVLKKN